MVMATTVAVIPNEGDEGEPQTATAADIMHPLPLVDGLVDAVVEVLKLPLKLVQEGGEPNDPDEQNDRAGQEKQ